MLSEYRCIDKGDRSQKYLILNLLRDRALHTLQKDQAAFRVANFDFRVLKFLVL